MRLHEVYESEQYVHLVYEQVKGAELLSKLKARHTYTEGDAAEIMRGLLDIVNSFHEQNVIHRDLRPPNILVR